MRKKCKGEKGETTLSHALHPCLFLPFPHTYVSPLCLNFRPRQEGKGFQSNFRGTICFDLFLLVIHTSTSSFLYQRTGTGPYLSSSPLDRPISKRRERKKILWVRRLYSTCPDYFSSEQIVQCSTMVHTSATLATLVLPSCA